MADKKLKIIIAGGGTGGHLFPGVAIAEEFLKRGETDILFVGAGNRLEKDVLGSRGLPLRPIGVKGLKGKGLARAVVALVKLPGSIGESYRIIREFRPKFVVGVGGYSSGPMVLTAYLMGIGTAVAEQNVLPGLTNRILGKFVDRVFLTYSGAGKWFAPEKVQVTGNPVRADFLAAAGADVKRGNKFAILIFGGSQGARAINRTMANALAHLPVRDGDMRFIHQTGHDDLRHMEDIYRNYEADAEVVPFIGDMAAAYREADLVICRAGATSIAELTVMGKASVLIPYPFAVDDHQRKNAEILARAGASVVIDERELDGKELAEIIARFYHRRELLREMEQKAASLGNIRAAADIVDACLALTDAK